MLYAKETQTRELTDISGMWQFKVEWSNTKISPKETLQDPIWMAVPGSFDDQVMDEKIRQHVGYFWYETTFEIGKEQLDKRIVLNFGSVTHRAEVYVNGELVTTHVGGFTPFEAQINEAVHLGKNDLKVRFANILDNTTLPSGELSKGEDGELSLQPRFDFYNYSGIHRPVRIYTTNTTYIDDITVNYSIEKDGSAVVTPKTAIKGDCAQQQFKIVDQMGNVVAQGNSNDGALKIDNVHLWQPMQGYMYELVVSLKSEDGKLLDQYSQEFGVRTIAIKNDKILVNGQEVYLKGFGRHEDFAANGRGLNLSRVNMDHNIMKWIGANSFRTSHYPYSEEEMLQADREGFLVIDEVPAVGLFNNFTADMSVDSQAKSTWEVLDTTQSHRQAIQELIARDKNHPSVFMWSIANEPAGAERGAFEYFEPLVKLAKQLDPQKRPVTIVNLVRSDADHDKISSLVDVLCLNRYYGWYTDHGNLQKGKSDLKTEIEKWHRLYPDKPIMFTEFGVDTVPGLHSRFKAPYSEEFQVDYYKAYFEVFDQFDYVVGEQLWQFADFQTSGNVIIRVDGNKKGVFTRDRQPKPIVYVLKERWAKK